MFTGVPILINLSEIIKDISASYRYTLWPPMSHPWASYPQNCGLRMRREWGERFPCHRRMPRSQMHPDEFPMCSRWVFWRNRPAALGCPAGRRVKLGVGRGIGSF